MSEFSWKWIVWPRKGDRQAVRLWEAELANGYLDGTDEISAQHNQTTSDARFNISNA